MFQHCAFTIFGFFSLLKTVNCNVIVYYNNINKLYCIYFKSLYIVAECSLWLKYLFFA
jgi:hypothetical protein